MRTIAIPLLVFKLTGSALNLGATIAIEYFAFGAFSLVGGSLADRLDRKRLMIACDAVRFLILTTFAVAYEAGWLSLGIVYCGLILHATCGAIFNGGQASSIPYVVGKENATKAVAALVGTESAANTIAPPLGGALFGLVGPLPALWANAATYVASLGSLGAVRDLGPDTATGLPKLHEIADDIQIGFRFLWNDRAMRLMAISSFVGNFVGFISFATLVPFIKVTLGGSDLSVGIAFGSLGLGSVIGSALAARIHAPFGKLVLACYAFGGIVEVPIMWTKSFDVVATVLGLASIAGGLSISNILGWRMRVIPEETVGRVFGAVRLLVLAGTLPGALLGGAIADVYGARIAQIVSILGSLTVTLWLTSFRTIREERR